ncbi:MAG TPA: alpha/beta hydrolase, partial [Thermomicrobiales bacterium]|nr:alpha/beta hydrolase [Thermomicrobiales bacterium]
GYGRSAKPDHLGPDAYAKRTMARDQIALMRALGFDRFSLAGHDRGGRVAYRLALDHPEVVDRLVLLDILPSAVMWERANAVSAMRGYHWYFMAQPEPFPEHMIGLDPAFFMRWKLRQWAAGGFEFDPECLVDYLACFDDPTCIHAACEDYRAGWTFDRQHDEEDRGVRTIAAPTLLLWGAEYSLATTDPIAAWREWTDDLRGYVVPGGHFLAEEAPDEVVRHLRTFLTS